MGKLKHKTAKISTAIFVLSGWGIFSIHLGIKFPIELIVHLFNQHVAAGICGILMYVLVPLMVYALVVVLDNL